MNHQPTYQKFGADSPQFAEVGKAMHEHWFHPTASVRYQREFSTDDISTLIQWMWHEHNGLRAEILDRDREIEKLKKKTKELTESNDEASK